MKRFYCENIDKDFASLSPEDAHHALTVLRLKAGDTLELVDGRGALAQATIEKIDKKSAQLKIYQLSTASAAKQKITIAVSLVKGDRFNWLIGKCTELGADRIIPVIFDRTVKLAKGSNAHKRWQKLAISAMKQCKRLFLPVIDPPVTLSEAVNLVKIDNPETVILTGSLSSSSSAVNSIENGDIAVFIGPEGGITEQEQDLLTQSGGTLVKIGPNVLRTETAAVAFCAILSSILTEKQR